MTWTHVICTACWNEMSPERAPVVVLESQTEACCWCGAVTEAGIYLRENPNAPKLNCAAILHLDLDLEIPDDEDPSTGGT